MNLRLSVVDARLRARDLPAEPTVWTLAFAAVVPPAGFGALALGANEAYVALGGPLVPDPKTRTLRPVTPGSADAEIDLDAALGATAISRWVIGAAAVVATEGRTGGRAANDLAQQLRAALITAAGEQAIGVASPFIPGAAVKEPEPGSSLARLADGPCHRVIKDIVTSDDLDRQAALAAVGALLRPVPQEVAPRSSSKEKPGDGAEASLLSARIVAPAGTDPVRLDGPLLDDAGKPFGQVDGHYRLEI